MKKGRKPLLILFSTLLLFSFLISCVVTPKVVHDPDNKTCRLTTNKRVLKIKIGKMGGDKLSAMIGSITGAITGLVSGSVVLVGNTIHWLEKQGKCNNSDVKLAYKKLIAPLIDQGGKLIE